MCPFLALQIIIFRLLSIFVFLFVAIFFHGVHFSVCWVAYDFSIRQLCFRRSFIHLDSHFFTSRKISLRPGDYSPPGECFLLFKITGVLKTSRLPGISLSHSPRGCRAAGRRAANAQIDQIRNLVLVREKNKIVTSEIDLYLYLLTTCRSARDRRCVCGCPAVCDRYRKATLKKKKSSVCLCSYVCTESMT